MLTPRQALKIGGLQVCADAGLTTEETVVVIKEAIQLIKAGGLTAALGKSLEGLTGSALTKPIEGLMTGAGQAIGSAGSTLTNTGLAGLVLGPPLLGLGAGYAASRLTDVDEEDVKAVKKRELIAEYRRQASQLKRRRKSFRLPLK